MIYQSALLFRSSETTVSSNKTSHRLITMRGKVLVDEIGKGTRSVFGEYLRRVRGPGLKFNDVRRADETFISLQIRRRLSEPICVRVSATGVAVINREHGDVGRP